MISTYDYLAWACMELVVRVFELQVLPFTECADNCIVRRRAVNLTHEESEVLLKYVSLCLNGGALE